MRIYAVADIHAKPDRIQQIRQNVERFKPDIMVLAGDIVNFTRPEPIVKNIGALKIPVLAITGNTDPARIEIIFKGNPSITSVNRNSLTLDGITFAGISGTTPLPFLSKICFGEKKALEKLVPFLNSPAVFIAHTPPRGTLDLVGGKFHAGSIALRDFINTYQPELLLCGHIHESSGVDKIGRTIVANCAMGAQSQGILIDMNADNGTTGIKTKHLKNQ